MAGGWPDQIWAPWQDNADPMTGMADFNRPKDPRVQYGINKGLPSDWRDTYKTLINIWSYQVEEIQDSEESDDEPDVDWSQEWEDAGEVYE